MHLITYQIIYYAKLITLLCLRVPLQIRSYYISDFSWLLHRVTVLCKSFSV